MVAAGGLDFTTFGSEPATSAPRLDFGAFDPEPVRSYRRPPRLDFGAFDPPSERNDLEPVDPTLPRWEYLAQCFEYGRCFQGDRSKPIVRMLYRAEDETSAKWWIKTIEEHGPATLPFQFESRRVKGGGDRVTPCFVWGRNDGVQTTTIAGGLDGLIDAFTRTSNILNPRSRSASRVSETVYVAPMPLVEPAPTVTYQTPWVAFPTLPYYGGPSYSGGACASGTCGF